MSPQNPHPNLRQLLLFCRRAAYYLHNYLYPCGDFRMSWTGLSTLNGPRRVQAQSARCKMVAPVDADATLQAYKQQMTDAFYKALCIRDFPCQSIERHNKPEIESGRNSLLLLPPVQITRHEGEGCYIEPSINSCRISFSFAHGDELEDALAAGCTRYLGLKAEDLPILRRVPVHGYQVSFLITAAHLKEHTMPDLVAFLVNFACTMPTFIAELKGIVRKHAHLLAAADAK